MNQELQPPSPATAATFAEHPPRRAAWAWMIAGVALVALLRIVSVLPSHALQNDFAHYYLSSRLLAEGQDPYRTPLQPLYEKHGFVFDPRIPNGTNPPPLMWLIVPFSLLPPIAAHWLWSALSGLCLAACLVMVRRMVCPDWSREAWWASIAVILLSYPVFDHFVFSQVQLVLAALLLGAFGLQRTGRPDIACVLAALAAALKLFPVLMLPWFLFHAVNSWKQALRRVVIVGVTLSLIVSATGLDMWQGFVERGLPVISTGTMNQWGNQSLPSLVLNIASAHQSFELGRDANRFWWLVASAVGAATLFASYLLVWITNAEVRVKFSLLLLAMVVSGTTAWTHYFVFLIWPAFVVVHQTAMCSSSVRRFVAQLMVILLVIPVGDFVSSRLSDPPIIAKVLLNYLPLLGAVLAAGLLIASIRFRGGRDHQETALTEVGADQQL